MSIRRTLLLSLLSGLVVCAVVVAAAAYLNTANELHELFTDDMKRMALVVEEQTFPENKQPINANEDISGEPEESSIIQIWDNKGALLRVSPQAIEIPLQAKEGFTTLIIHSQKWNIYTLKAGEKGFVQIAQPRKMVTTMMEESVERTFLPFIILFVILGFGAWFIVSKSLSPLSQLSEVIASRKIDQLKPISVSKVPVEVSPIINALNSLLEKLEKAMTLQRQFTADAAHELRTPLTAIRLQADLLKRALSPNDKTIALAKLSEGIDRSINLTAQLLNASRSAAVKMLPDFRDIFLDQILRSSLTTFAPIALERNIELVLERCDECVIKGDEEGIYMLINNLLDNALRYTPAKGIVSVGLAALEDKIILKVVDTGLGIAQDQRDKVFQRFYRIPGTPSQGAGLGLSIVKNVADNHGAMILVTNGPRDQGTMFRIVFLSQANDMAA